MYYYPTGQLYESFNTYGKTENWGYGTGGYSSNPALVQANLNEDNNDLSNGWYGPGTTPMSLDLYIGHGAYDPNQNNQAVFFGQADSQYVDNYSTFLPTTNWVHSSDVANTYPQDEHFAFLWVCFNGNWNYYMPVSWSDYKITQTSGYSSPDSSGYCFIGFDSASPWLYETFPSGNTYQSWLKNFYETALYTSSSYSTVNEALDMASWTANGGTGNWGSSVLSTGFTTYWPYTQTYAYNNHMVVWGDGNIYLETTLYYWYYNGQFYYAGGSD